jgi:MFS family permease
VRWTKWWELGIMLIAMAGFMLEWYSLLLVVLFLVGTQATFFTPAKYSSIPDLVSHDDLTKGNAFIELGTFLAILFGTLLGGLAGQSRYVVTGVGVPNRRRNRYSSLRTARRLRRRMLSRGKP